MDEGAQTGSDEVRRGEEFMALYSGHQRRLYLYVMTLLPASVDAEDVLQETNLVLWRKFDQYLPGTNFFAWACQITRYEVLKYRERQRGPPDCSIPTSSTRWPMPPSATSNTSTSFTAGHWSIASSGSAPATGS